MNEYLKYKYAYYFVKLEKILNTNNYGYKDVLFNIRDTFNIELSIYKGDHLYNETRENEKLYNHKETKHLVKELKKYLKENENKNLNCKLKTKIEKIGEIYNLNEKELELLEIMILSDNNEKIEKITDVVYSCDTYYKFTKILNVEEWEFDELIDTLQSKGVLNSDDRDVFNSKIKKIIMFDSIKTKNEMIKILIGETHKTDLKSDDYIHFEKEKNLIEKIIKSGIKNKTKGINILLYGGVGTGKTEFAKLVAQNAKVDLYEVDFPIRDKEEKSRYARIQDLKSKGEILSRVENTCILFDEAEDIMNNFTSSTKAYFNKLLENTSVPTIWTTNNIYNVDSAFLRRMTYALEFRKLTEEERLKIWKNVLKKNNFKVCKKKIEQLNKDYDIAPSLITNAIKTTKLIEGSENDFETFIENVAQVVCKKRNVKNKKEFEFKGYNDNLVNTDLDTRKLTQRIKDCNKLNFSLCLYGEPGTGKSLYARYLANELGIEVVFKRASDLISSYVGQTEQNIAEAFAEAKSKKAMLIFDEADTFLQNRNNAVRSWEVSQVNEMLTWMESHEYPFVCTTNLLETLDEASLRRFTFKIKFNFLNKEQINQAMKHFFNIKNSNIDVKGLTAGDFATVKKKADFLNISDINELTKMLQDEVKLKKSNQLKNSIGF